LVASKFDISKNNISLIELYSVAKSDIKIYISSESINHINNSRKYLEDKLNNINELIYGVNTGFGSLCDKKIDFDDIEQLQENLVNSHDCGVGEDVPHLIKKLIFLIKIRSLSFGFSGIRNVVVERLILFYNSGVFPSIKTQGSLGASGDLAPLAALAQTLIQDSYNHQVNQSSLKLSYKEGLALLNGTQFMSSYALYSVVEAIKLYHFANLISSISIDAFLCKRDSFHPLVSSIRNHVGQNYTAKEILKILDGSTTFTNDKQYVQDPYSFRCIPQVHGASYDAIKHVQSVVNIEINSVTDNPLIFADQNQILSAGNFHGQSLALAMDYLAIALSEISSISERRVYKLISGERNLPIYLTKNPGINSGLMITQYTAASIVSQNKQLATPSSVDSIVSSNGQEDHVSMGANSATKLYKVVNNVKTTLAIELLNAVYALKLQPKCNGTSSPLINNFLSKIKKIIKIYENDGRPPSLDINLLRNFIDDFDILDFLKINK
tara:strand:+ start:22804 stop:24291 length:1488 start_codon:yes stop_codon:yes gene_type:complete